MKYVLALIATIFLFGFVNVPVAHADTSMEINTTGNLTDAQKADLAAQAQKMAAQNASQPPDAIPTPTAAEHVKQWVDIGTEIGTGLAASAKSLGIAANDFVNTPVGKWTAAIIVWHFLGNTAVHIVFGFLWLITLVPLWIILYRRISATVTITELDPKLANGKKRVKTRVPQKLTDGQSVAYSIFGILILLVGLIVTFTF